MTRASDTIYALSSGRPPAAIAIIRISGSQADEALKAVAGKLPPPRRAAVATFRHPLTGEILDHGLVLRFSGPASATGEDLVELHLHGGRAVVDGVVDAVGAIAGLRAAEAGEFTRRAFENGRIDLTAAEGLADLLMAETSSQRRAALMLAGGGLSRRIYDWERAILGLSAQLEAALDFADEEDVDEEVPPRWYDELRVVASAISDVLDKPPAERLKDGVRVVIAGPPNAGKSSLLNAIVQREAAITSSLAGTTRDLVEAPMAISGVPFLFIDTAGLRATNDAVEAIGVERAQHSLDNADIILWLGAPEAAPSCSRTLLIRPKSDLRLGDAGTKGLSVSALTGDGLDALTGTLLDSARAMLPADGDVAINRRQRDLLADCLSHLRLAASTADILIVSEALRHARVTLDRLTGRAGVEDMLDALFRNFCIGK